MSDLALGDETSGVQEAAVSVKKCGHLAAAVNVNKLKKAVTASLLANAKCQRCPKYRGAGNDALWLCLKCAVVHCGRNDADHARLHFCAETDSKHCVAAALDSAAAVWCHACDEFVVLDSSAKRNLVLADVKAVLRDARVSAPNVRSADGMASADHPSLPVTPPPIASSKVPVRGLSGAKPAKIRPQTPGLQNLGNTCFFNSVMQCLVYTDALIPYYANGVKDGAGAKQDEVVGKALSKAFLNFLNVVKTQLRAAKTTTVSPVGLFTQLKLKYEAYRMMSQQDAHELLRTLLGGIKDEQTPRDVEGREIRTGEPGCAEYGSIFVDKVFGGKLVSVVLCATCKGVSYQFEEFLDLSLSLNMDGPGSEKKKGFFAQMKSKLSPTISKKGTPGQSRSSSPFLLDSNLDQAIEKLNLNSTPPGSAKSEPTLNTTPPPPLDPLQTRLTERLFRTIDTVSAQQGLPPGSVPQPSAKTLTLAKCLENFLACDILEGANGLVCDRCNGIVPAYDGAANKTASLPSLSLQEATQKTPYDNSADDDEQSDPRSNLSTGVEINYNDAASDTNSDLDEESVLIEDIGVDPLPVVSAPAPIPSPQPPHPPATAKKAQILTNGVKRYLLHQYPRVLAMHLKRFERVGSGVRTRKMDAHVAFDEILDLGMYLSPEAVLEKQPRRQEGGGGLEVEEVRVPARLRDVNNGLYRLYGVVVHAGSLFGGHYVAYVRVKMPEGCVMPVGVEEAVGREFWVYMSDTTVKFSSLEEVLKQQAYILFYEHVDSAVDEGGI